MSDLNDYVASLKLEVAVPGTFAANFPTTSDDDLVAMLSNAFAQGQLDGFFLTQELDVDTSVVTPDLSAAGRALVVLYAAENILRLKIMEMRQRTSYEAGPVKYETENAATVMVQILKDLQARRARILLQAASARRASGGFSMVDAYSDRLTGEPGVWVGASDFFAYELTGA